MDRPARPVPALNAGPPLAHPLRGIACVVAASLCFALLDTTSQYMGPVVPVVMAVWMRYLVQTLMTLALLWPQQGRRLLQMQSARWHLVRGLLLLASSASAFLSLVYVPVGEFTALMMVIPLVVTVLAATVLGERVSPLRWLLLAGGLAGALIVLRPKGSGFSATLLLPLLVVIFNAAAQLLTSRMVRTEDAGAMHFSTGVVGLLACSAALPWAWKPLQDPLLWLLAALLGVFSSVGHYLLIRAYHHAPVGRLMPYVYTQIAFATLAGAVIFGHRPDAWTVSGIALIVLCGIVGVRARRPRPGL